MKYSVTITITETISKSKTIEWDGDSPELVKSAIKEKVEEGEILLTEDDVIDADLDYLSIEVEEEANVK